MAMIKQTIVPHLWFNEEAQEASKFYTAIFPSSEVTHVTTLDDTPSGDCDVVSFGVWNEMYMAISAGPLFKFNPSISFMVNFDPLMFGSSSENERAAREKMDEVWNALSDGGSALMPIGKYPFSERYGWVQDKYGLSWQLILTDPKGDPRPSIMPSMMFVGENCGKAEEARNFYLSVFRNSKPGELVRYGPEQGPDREGTVMFSDFMLENRWFTAMDSAHEHSFSFNEALSFIVYCDHQDDIDYYWEKLSAVPEAEECGWLKDKYGVSWQIVPFAMDVMMQSGSRAQIARLTQALFQMKKINLVALQSAYDGGGDGAQERI